MSDPAGARYFPLGKRAQWANRLLGLGVVVNTLFVLLLLSRVLMVIRLTRGDRGMESLLTVSDSLFQVLSLLVTATYLAVAVAFGLWYHRAYVNVEAMAPVKRKYTPALAVLAWFLPGANLFMPYQVVQEIWKSAAPQEDPTDWTGAGKGKGTPLAGVWWFCWLASSILGVVVNRMPAGENALRTFLTASEVTAVARALLVVAFVLLSMLVTQATERQEQRAEWLKEWRSGVAAPGAEEPPKL